MINLNFMPSRQLALYAAKLFLTRSLAVLVALVLVLMTLDLLGESGKILKVPGNGESSPRRGRFRSKAMTCPSTCRRSTPSGDAEMK